MELSVYRVAKQPVTFCENYDVLILLKKNIANLNFEKKSNIISKDIFNIDNQDLLNKKFEVIFLDPPYKEKKIIILL